MVRVLAELGRYHLQKLAFDGADVFAGREASAVGDAEYMGVHGNRRLVENDVEDDAGGLVADAGQGFEGGAIVGHLAAMVFQQQLGEAGDVLRLGLIQADAADIGQQSAAARRAKNSCRASGFTRYGSG